MIHRLLAAALAAGLCACGAEAPEEVPPPGAEEYAIYSEILRAEVLPEHKGFPLLMDSTWARSRKNATNASPRATWAIP